MSLRLNRVSWVCSLLGAGLACLLSTAASAQIIQDPPETVMKKMLEATKAKSYEDFIAEVDDGFRAALTRQMFDGASGLLGPRLRQGYKTSYLGKLKQQGSTVYLWKLEFSDGKDEALVKMAVKAGKVAGYLIQ